MDKFIIGAGGHSRSLIGLLQNIGVHPKGVYDNNYIENEHILEVPMVGKLSDIPDNHNLIIGSGDPLIRAEWSKKFTIDPHRYIHSTAIVEENISLGKGVHIFADAFINVEVQIGEHALINSKSLIEHESVIGDFSHIAVGAIVCGRCKIGNNVVVGAGAVVKDGVEITNDVIIGAGAVVTKNINESGVYIGMPAKKIK